MEIGVVGVAPSARILPIKVLDDTGQGEWSNLICGIDYITGLDQDSDPTNNVRVANMSLGDTGSIGNCSDGGVREAICTSTAAGIVYIAAAGNSTVDTAGFIPAAFPEVIAVSSINDLDGEPGGLGGCFAFIFYCDDRLSEFSNYGSTIAVAAPGFEIYSDWTGGGYNTIDGTSMASPHVAGVAALALSVQPALSPSDVRNLLKATGDCPNTQPANANGTCTGKGQWGNDPDGIAEPVVNALRAAQNAGPYDHPPTVALTSPTNGSSVSGVVPLAATASDDVGVSSVEFTINGAHLTTDTDGSNGWTASWNTAGLAPGVYTVAARPASVSVRTSRATGSATTGHRATRSPRGTTRATLPCCPPGPRSRSSRARGTRGLRRPRTRGRSRAPTRASDGAQLGPTTSTSNCAWTSRPPTRARSTSTRWTGTR
ncbi:MAG: hypothetical protein E6I45_13650 [Chloroflexi bacterium]|nr:MAG: hypothetical protein E6I45_13650 [Chloroflexota bacterium]